MLLDDRQFFEWTAVDRVVTEKLKSAVAGNGEKVDVAIHVISAESTRHR